MIPALKRWIRVASMIITLPSPSTSAFSSLSGFGREMPATKRWMKVASRMVTSPSPSASPYTATGAGASVEGCVGAGGACVGAGGACVGAGGASVGSGDACVGWTGGCVSGGVVGVTEPTLLKRYERSMVLLSEPCTLSVRVCSPRAVGVKA